MIPLRVAQVIGTTSGGTGSHVVMLAAGSQVRGLTVSVIGPAAAREQFSGTAVAYLPVDIGDRPRPVRDAAALWALRRRLRQAAPDVVHAHGLRAGAFAALALIPAAGPRPALLVTVHNAAPARPAAAAVYRVLELIVARRATAVRCASGDLAARMRSLGARDTGQAVVAAPEFAAPSDAAVRQARTELGAAGLPVLVAAGGWPSRKGSACCSMRRPRGSTATRCRCWRSPERGRWPANWPRRLRRAGWRWCSSAAAATSRRCSLPLTW